MGSPYWLVFRMRSGGGRVPDWCWVSPRHHREGYLGGYRRSDFATDQCACLSLLVMVGDLAATGGDTRKYFTAGLTVAITLIVLAYLLIFPALIALRIRRPGLVRPFRVPGGWFTAWLVTVVSTGWALLAAFCLLWPGLGTSDPDRALPAGFEESRFGFESMIAAPIVGFARALHGSLLPRWSRPDTRAQRGLILMGGPKPILRGSSRVRRGSARDPNH
jgi:uncharacterized membrane protein